PQKLLNITDDKTASKEVQKEHLEKTKQRQEVAKQALKDLTEMLNSRSHRQDVLREQAETPWRAMEIPKEFWPSPKEPLAEMLQSIHKQLEQQQEMSAGRRENIPDTEVLRRASGGLALQGIYRTSRAGDVLATREQLLRVPEGFQLAGPEQGLLLERREFSSHAAESTFTKSMQQLGFSMSISTKSAFWGVNPLSPINLGAVVDHSSSSQSQGTHQCHSEQSYFCTTKFQYIPLASCYFQRHQLRLSDVPLRELQVMEQILGFTQKEDNLMFVKMCESFFSRFGSHINQGPLHFGGIFWWKASTEGFRAEQLEEVKRQTSEALNSFVRAICTGGWGSLGGTLDISKCSSEASVRVRAAEKILYMAKEMEVAYEEYVNLKEQDADRAEASLLLMGLTVTPGSQKLSPEQKRERLVFMEDHMKGLWSTRIKNLLQKHSADGDWERLERDLHSLISECLDDKLDEQRIMNILTDLQDMLLTPEMRIQFQSKPDSSQSKANEAIANQEFLQLLKRLGLESHYPRKMGMGDFCTICRISLQDSQPSKDKELPVYFLQKLLTVDYQVRDLTCWEKSNPTSEPLPKTTANDRRHSESFEQFYNKLKEASPECASRDSHVHPMDLQMAIFHCADDFLRQTLATKLAFCQLSLPLLLPNPGTSQIEFPLYALSQIQRSWKETEKSGKQAKSKGSQLLNAVLSKRKHDTFFHRHCRGSTRERLLMEGVVEIACPGYPVELMDGDASYLPLRWVGAIFDSLIERLGDKRVFVLSVLGIQSTGKSTLLNAMFGLQFKVSAGRCTRGAFMQLIPVGEELQQDLGFDFVLVVDTEGLRAIERGKKQSLKHDNELATFVIGVGNLTVINIFGENPAEMQDVLQIAVQAFLRMKKVNLSPSCLFVHQNVGEATAKEQNMEGQRRLQEKLDEMTVVAAQQEFCDVSSFSDVIGFDVKTHIHYFAHLWEGNPPMAPPNPTYSQNVQQLKSKILQAAKQQPQRSILKLSSLKHRIGDLWNALLNENFVFSFKNSLEIAAYRNLESAFSDWTWRLRSHFLDVEMRLNNKIQNGDLQNVTREHLEGLMQEISNAIEKEVEKYFREDKDHETLVQWKSSTEMKLKELREALLVELEKNSKYLIERQKEYRKVDARKLEYEAELLRRSKELALTLKQMSLHSVSLGDYFNSVWNQWIDEVFYDVRPPEQVDIDAEVENVLLEHFNEPGICEKITSFPKDRKFSFDSQKHILRKKSLYVIPNLMSISNLDVIKFQHITDNIIACVEANIAKKEQEKRDYSRNFIHEILNEVQKGVNSVPRNAKCTFNKQYSIDLSLYLCKMAAERFKAMHEAFQKANDPVVYLSSKREDFFQCFLISCKGATSITTFVVFLCDKIEPALRQAVFERTAKDIAEDVKRKFPDFRGNRANLEVCILRYLAEQENFAYFKQYLTSPKLFFRSYIERRVKSHCLDESRRLPKFLESSLNLLYRNILSAVSLSTQIVKDRKDRQDKISLWLDEFCRELAEVINLPRSDLKGIEHQEVTDIEFLSSVMAEGLAAVKDRIKAEFTDADLSSFSRQPHTILAEHFSGCWEQCPFCGAVCTNTMRDHP
ncbi:PREDICTED: interferon-induced very large GTPase 1-like, partial [Ficedula albicollis]|uniref:interferon-induced very large GTPase 1-like n=1 Tax=Ficedula albicollis TaxID=59894 RepID=UPI0007AD89D5